MKMPHLRFRLYARLLADTTGRLLQGKRAGGGMFHWQVIPPWRDLACLQPLTVAAIKINRRDSIRLILTGGDVQARTRLPRRSPEA